MAKALVETTDSMFSHRKKDCDRPSTWRESIGDAVVRTFIKNGFKLISRLDRDIGILIDNCLGFLYSVDLGQDMRRDLGKIEGALYDMVYLGRTPAGCEFKEDAFPNPHTADHEAHRPGGILLRYRSGEYRSARILAASRTRGASLIPMTCRVSPMAVRRCARGLPLPIEVVFNPGKLLDTPFSPIVVL